MKQNKVVNASIVFIAVILLIFVLKTFQVFLRPFTIAIIITLSLIPLFRISEKYRIPKSIMFLVLILVLLFVFHLASLLVTVESRKIDEKLPEYQKTINEGIDFITLTGGISRKQLGDLIDPKRITHYINSFIKGVASLITEIFVAILFSIFLIPSHKKLFNLQLNRSQKKRFKSALNAVEKSIRDYLYVKTTISIGTALVSAVVLYFFKVDFILVLALIIFLLNFIPNLGSIIAVGIAVGAYLLKFGIGFGSLWLLGILILIQVIFGNILEPKFAGTKLKLSPVLILLSLFLWYWIWGIIGVILAIPLMSIIKIIFEHIESTKNIARFMS